MLIRLTLVVALLAFVLATVPAAEAQDVDFSGTWTLYLDASELPERLGGALSRRGGATVVVTQGTVKLTSRTRMRRTNQRIRPRSPRPTR